MELWQLAARAAIEDLIKRYAHYGDAGKSAELAALFADDGVMIDSRGGRHAGPAAVLAFLQHLVEAARASGAPIGFVRHNITNILITALTPDSAEAASYFTVITAHGVDHSGRYRDQLVRTHAGWRFAQRSIRIDPAPGNSGPFLKAVR